MELDIKSLERNLPEMSVMGIITFISAGAMVFGGVVPYIPQYRTIRKTMSCEGFSTFVCLVLLLANLLRVFFWFGKHFELPLLAQSILMIVAMMVMVEICVRVKNQSEIIQSRQHRLRDMDWSFFWKWTDFLSYIEFMLFVAAILSVSTYLLIDYSVYVETIGFLAVFIEAMLGTPQLYRNYTKRSTEGMSVMMVIMWLCGDSFKTGYFILRSAPTQFWFCGILQILVDIAILLQVAFYSMYPSRPVISKHAQ